MSAAVLGQRSPSHFSFRYEDRVNELNCKLQDYARKMHVVGNVRIKITDFNKLASAKLNSNTIKIPFWFLFKHEDIPYQFQVSGVDDPRLGSGQFLNQVARWINERMRESGISENCSHIENSSLQIFLELLCNPELYEKAKEFTLSHEWAHLSHKETWQYQQFVQFVYEGFCVGGLTVGYFLLAIAVSLIPFLNTAIKVNGLGLAAVLTGAGMAEWVEKQEETAYFLSREEEKHADLAAASMLNTAAGGIYFFQTHINHLLLCRRHNEGALSNIDVRGNDLNDKRHPLLTDRVAYLQQWQLAHAQRV